MKSGTAPLRNPPPTLDKEVAVARAALADALNGYDEKVKGQLDLANHIETWHQEIERLEAGDPCNTSAMSRLAQVREQVTVGQRHQAEQEKVDFTACLDGPLNQCFRLFESTASRDASAWESHGREVLPEFFYHDETRVAQCLQSIPIIVDLKSVNRLWSFASDKAALARKCLAWLDVLGRGLNPWTPSQQ